MANYNARAAVRSALAAYLRTNLASAWPNLTVSENWPTPQAPFPKQAVTVLSPSKESVSYHVPVVWDTAKSGDNLTTTYSYGIAVIPLQLDVWSEFEVKRDNLAADIAQLLQRSPEVTLNTITPLVALSMAPGLVLPVSGYYNTTAEYVFQPVSTPIEGSSPAFTGEWRSTWIGTATIYLLTQETVPAMEVVWAAINDDPSHLIAAAPETITGLSPSSGSVGSSVTITGTNFYDITRVEFNGTAATSFTVNSPTQITVTVPVGATSGYVRVINPIGLAISSTPFIVS